MIVLYLTWKEAIDFIGCKSRKPLDKGVDRNKMPKPGMYPLEEVLKAKQRYENDLNENKTAKAGKTHRCWNGGIRNDFQSGYRYVWMPEHPKAIKNYVPEHVYVMEQVLGRYLTEYEHVHHVNHIRNDNRFENLQLMDRKEHMIMHLNEGRDIKNQNYRNKMARNVYEIFFVANKEGKLPTYRDLNHRGSKLPSSNVFDKIGGYKRLKEWYNG